MKDDRILEIPINLIKSLDNSRLRIDETGLVSLMEDIKHRGLLQPIGVVVEDDFYVIRFGNRRLAACKKLGWRTIPAVVANREIDLNNFMADNIAENLHREDITPFELAKQVTYFRSEGMTNSEISVLLSVPVSRIEKCIKIQNGAPETFKESISYMSQKDIKSKNGKVSATVANEILSRFSKLSDSERLILFEEAKQKELGIAQVSLISNLVNHGMSFEKAMDEYSKYKSIRVDVPFNLAELKKYDLSATKLIKGIINGDLKPNKKLLP